MEKENKPLSDKDYNRIRQICVNLAIEQTELKHKQAVKEAYEEIEAKCESFNWSAYPTIREAQLTSIHKEVFKDKFGFEFG
jgi:hypothetical protein